MKFILMMQAPRGKGDWDVMQWPPEDLHNHIKFMKTLNEELRADGTLVSAEGLAPPEQARIVRAGASGAPEVTDGPFAEAKEFLAGFWIVQVDTPEQAHAIAARASAAPGQGGLPMRLRIEVRQVMSQAPIDV